MSLMISWYPRANARKLEPGDVELGDEQPAGIPTSPPNAQIGDAPCDHLSNAENGGQTPCEQSTGQITDRYPYTRRPRIDM